MLLERVKELINQHSMTIAELERKTGLSPGSIRNWGKSIPSGDKIQKVADYFDVSTDYLLGRVDTPYINSGKPTNLTVEEALASVMSSNGEPLTENDREILKGLFEAYIEKSKNK